MRLPATHDLLDAWDRARAMPMPERVLCVLDAVDSALGTEGHGALPLGRRDRRLLDLRRQLFGDRVEGLVACPGCGETIELRFAVSDLAGTATADGAATDTYEAGDWRVRYRLPTGADAVALASARGASGRDLVSRCVLEATHGDAPRTGDLPDAILEALASAMAEADPHADITLDARCPACAHRFAPAFDAAAFVWTELSAWARGLLADVAALARAFGWREADVLAMSPARRRDYLELVAP